MPPHKPAKPTERYYTLGQACQACRLKPHQVRYWEACIPALKPAKHRGNRRLYTQEEINTLLRVRHGVYDQGQSLASLQAQFPTPTRPTSPTQELIHELQAVIDVLKS